ncbi:hypothetical protein HYU13_03950 [Candidatus Woesearchaeota archaeon]|nr:hypothetical protein [Candidatus Woesearchaeota archaeon]
MPQDDHPYLVGKQFIPTEKYTNQGDNPALAAVVEYGILAPKGGSWYKRLGRISWWPISLGLHLTASGLLAFGNFDGKSMELQQLGIAPYQLPEASTPAKPKSSESDKVMQNFDKSLDGKLDAEELHRFLEQLKSQPATPK